MTSPGFLICTNCLNTKLPGNRFKVCATEEGLQLMEDHVKECN